MAVVYIVVDLAVVETFSHEGTHAQRRPRVSGADILTVSATINITAVLLVASKKGGRQAAYVTWPYTQVSAICCAVAAKETDQVNGRAV